MLFRCQYLLSILFVGIVLVLAQPPTGLPRQYLARKDFINLIKAAEFSITDPLQKKLYYRIESSFHPLQQVEVIRYPVKMRTARLASKLHLITYRAEFSILNETTSRWIDGVIEQNFEWFHLKFVIRWNGHQINMTNTNGGLTFRFRDESNDLLADYRLQRSPVFWRKKHHVKVYTNKYPDEIFFCGLVACERILPKTRSVKG